MKNNFMLIAGMVCIPSFSTLAQISFFQVDQDVHYEVTGCTPGSQIGFYSKPWGGELLRTETANANGSSEIITTVKFKPAFVLNFKTADQSEIAGTGRTFVAEPREFLFQHLTIENKAGSNVLHWKADIDPRQDIFFEILRSTDGVNYSVISTTIASKIDKIQDYSFSDLSDNRTSLYKVRILNGGQMRYISEAIGTRTVKVFPTATTSNIRLVVSPDQLGSQYTIRNIHGQVVNQGKLSTLQSDISLADVSSGEYVITVCSESGTISEKLIKL